MPFYLKKQIKQLDISQQAHTLIAKASKTKTVPVSVFVKGIGFFVNIIANIFQSSKDIPVIGFYAQTFGTLTESIETLVDPEKTTVQKIGILVFLALMTGISIAAFVIGLLFAAVVGTVFAIGMAIAELAICIKNAVTSYQLSSRYDNKIAFDRLVDSREIPTGHELDELFETRAVELNHMILCLKDQDDEAKEKIQDELRYIYRVLENKGIIIGSNGKNSAFKLLKLYKKRATLFEQLVTKISEIPTTQNSAETVLAESMALLQKKILKTDKKIERMTISAGTLLEEHLLAKENFVFSLSGFGFALTGALLAIIGLMMFMLTLNPATIVVIPSAIIIAITVIGVTLAVFSLAKFVAEKVIEHQDDIDNEKKDTSHNEDILNEALDEYKNTASVLTTSYAKSLQELSSNPTPTVSESQEDNLNTIATEDHNLQPKLEPVFSRQKPEEKNGEGEGEAAKEGSTEVDDTDEGKTDREKPPSTLH